MILRQRKIAFVFLLLWLQLLLPASLIHSFCGHHDSDHPHFSFGLTLSEQHHHCLVLELSLPGIIHQTDDWQIKPEEIVSSDYAFVKVGAHFTDKSVTGIRGPPANRI